MKIRNLFILILTVAMAVPMFQSCKKGENDPFLSIKSRKARLCQDWKLVAAEGTQTSGGAMSTYTFNGTTWTEMGSGQTFSYNVTWTMSFDKGGPYTIYLMYTAIGGAGGTYTETIKGNWWFGSKNKSADYKDKETVVLQETSYSNSDGDIYTYSGANCPMSVIQLDKLSGSQMVTLENGTTTLSGVSSSTGTYTWEKK